MNKSILLLILLLLINPLSFAIEVGYMGKFSYLKGDTLSFHISNKLSSYTIKIYRYESNPKLIKTINNVAGKEYPLSDSSWLQMASYF